MTIWRRHPRLHRSDPGRVDSSDQARTGHQLVGGARPVPISSPQTDEAYTRRPQNNTTAMEGCLLADDRTADARMQGGLACSSTYAARAGMDGLAPPHPGQ